MMIPGFLLRFAPAAAAAPQRTIAKRGPSSVPRAGKPGPARGQKPAPQELELEPVDSIADVAPVRKIFTAKNGEIPLDDAIRPHLVAIGTTGDRAIIAVDREHVKGTRGLWPHVGLLRKSLREKGAQDVRVVGAKTDLIRAIYESVKSDAVSGPREVTDGGKLFDEFIAYGVEIDATDVHFIVKGNEGSARYRVHGTMEDMANSARGHYTAAQIESALGYAYNRLIASGTNSESQFSPEKSLSGMVPYTVKDKNFTLRWESGKGFDGFAAFLRYIPAEDMFGSMTYEQLGYSEDQAETFDLVSTSRQGMILVIGETNSGKSTLARRYLENIQDVHELNIITVEDPAENTIRVASLQRSLQRSFGDGASVDSFGAVKPAIMRSDPDVVFQGEIRDPESGEAAKTFVETGHQVIATLHARGILGSFSRLSSSDIGFSSHTLTSADFWSVLVSQKLVTTLCDCAKHADETEPALTTFIRERFRIDTKNMRTRNHSGCEKCNGRGTSGVTIVAEVYQPTRPFLRAMRDGDEYRAEHIWRSESDGRFDTPNMTGKTLFEHALYKAYLGKIDVTSLNRIMLIDRFEIVKQ